METHKGIVERHIVSGSEIWKITAPKIATNIFIHRDEQFKMNEGLIGKTVEFNHVHQFHGRDLNGDNFIDYAINITHKINGIKQ